MANHIDTIGCVCSWSTMLFGTKRWRLGTPPGEEPVEVSEVVQEQGDFMFWCAGTWHQTWIEEESLDVHGYVKLSYEQGSYARNLVGFAENAGRRELDGWTNVMEVADSCNPSNVEWINRTRHRIPGLVIRGWRIIPRGPFGWLGLAVLAGWGVVRMARRRKKKSE